MLCDGSGELRYGAWCRGCLNCQGSDDARDMETELLAAYAAARQAVTR